MLFNAQNVAFGDTHLLQWEELYTSSLLRVCLTELPQNDGQSSAWKREIKAKVEAFRSNWSTLLDPLIIPVALEVVVRPPPPSRQKNIHDLDNVLRTYLIPRVIETLKPLSSYAFTPGNRSREMPPLSTRIGLSRYEAWRLPPAPEGSSGFVSMAVVTDITGYDSVFRRIEKTVDKWVDSLE